MRELFPVRRDDGPAGNFKKFLQKYFHPAQVVTGLAFSTVGIGVTAAGVLYADGINFLIHNMPAYVMQSNHTLNAIDYVRDSYKGSFAQAIDAGWKQVPFSYCIGHYIGGKIREKVMAPFRRR